MEARSQLRHRPTSNDTTTSRPLRTTSSILADLALIVNARDLLEVLRRQFFAECLLKNKRQYEWNRVPGCAMIATRTVRPITIQATIRAERSRVLGMYNEGRLGIALTF